MSNSIKFNLNHIRLGLTELFAAAIDIYKFYSAQTEQGPALSPQVQSVKAKQGITTVRPEFPVDYDEDRNHKVGVGIIEGPCLVCKKICGIGFFPYTIIPSGTQFSGNYICGDCFQGHLDPVLQSVLDTQNDLTIAEKSHLEYLDGSGRSLEVFLKEDKEDDL